MRTIGICLRRPYQASGGRNGTRAGVMARHRGQGRESKAGPAPLGLSAPGGEPPSPEAGSRSQRAGRPRRAAGLQGPALHPRGAREAWSLPLRFSLSPFAAVPPLAAVAALVFVRVHRGGTLAQAASKALGPGRRTGCTKTSKVIRSPHGKSSTKANMTRAPGVGTDVRPQVRRNSPARAADLGSTTVARFPRVPVATGRPKQPG